MTGEGQMIAACIAQAFREACEVRPDPTRGSTGQGSFTPTLREAVEAWRFLTDTRGAWAESRETLCDMIGLCPDAVREAALHRGPSRYVRARLRWEREAIARRHGAVPC